MTSACNHFLHYFVILVLFHCCSGYISDYECDPGRCNKYVQERICDQDKIPEIQETFVTNETDVYIGIMEALTNPRISSFSQLIEVSALCAIKHVNENTTILPNIVMHPMFSDDRIGDGFGAGLCLGEANIPFSVGLTNSNFAVNAASVYGNVYGNHLVGIFPSTPLLSDKANFPNFSRIRISDGLRGKSVPYIMQVFGWERAATLGSVSESYSDGTTQSFLNEAKKVGIQVLASVSIPVEPTDDDIVSALQKIRETGLRIIMVSILYHLIVHRVYNIAEKLGYFDPNDPFIFIGLSTEINEKSTYDIKYGMIGFHWEFEVTPQNNEAYAKLTNCWLDSINDMDSNSPFYGVYGFVSTLPSTGYFGACAYDAVVVAAKAINEVGVANLKNQTMIRNYLKTINYEGASGSLKLDENGDRDGSGFYIYSWQNKSAEILGKISGVDFTFDSDLRAKIRFPGDRQTIPSDFKLDCKRDIHYNTSVSECDTGTRILTYHALSGDPVRYCPRIEPLIFPCDYPSIDTSSGVIIFSIFGLIFIALQLLVTLRQWKHPIVKMGQRHWLVALMVGGLITLLNTFATLGRPTTISCLSPSIFLFFGSIIQFGTLIVKSWRVQKIFVTSKLERRVITNQQLIKYMFLMLSGGLAAIILANTQDTPEPTSELQVIVGTDGNNHFIDVKQCAVNQFWSSLLVFYICIVVAYACKISFNIRNVESSFSEAWFIFISVYNSSLCAVAALLIIYGLEVTPVQQHSVVSIASTIACVANTSLIMIPKFIKIRQHEVIVSDSRSENSGGGSRVRHGSMVKSEQDSKVALLQTIERLSIENMELKHNFEQEKEKLLAEAENKISLLTNQLNELRAMEKQNSLA